MAPPTQVAAPPKGSISVGWLWVSFLNSSSHFSVLPSTSTSIFTVQALISSDSSSLSSLPSFFRNFATIVSHIHQIDGLCSADGFSGCQIFVICRLQSRILKFDAVDGCLESSMAAVVRPIGINHLDFRNGRVSLLAQEILLANLISSKSIARPISLI